MNIELHIERIILDGVDLDVAGQRLLGAATRAELARLLRQDGMTPRMTGATPLLRVDPITLDAGCGPLQMGVQLARALYGGIARPAK